LFLGAVAQRNTKTYTNHHEQDKRHIYENQDHHEETIKIIITNKTNEPDKQTEEI